MKIEELQNKKILILGFAREGIDTFRFLRRLFSKQILGIGDRLAFKKLAPKAKAIIKKDKLAKTHLGEDYLATIKNYDIVIKSPGIPLKAVKPFISKEQRLTSQTDIFFENCPGEIVGITGTKGKSTTTSLIYQILKKGGIKAHLVGNIGKPVLSSLFSATKRDVYAYELSSHQLAELRQSPHIAVFLNIYPEHLDYYDNFRDYARAKANICRYQTKNDYLIFNRENKIVNALAQKSKAKKVPINIKNVNKVIKTEDIPLKGIFNLDNVAASIEVGKVYNVPTKKIAQAIKTFKSLPHRLEFVGAYKGINFYNDSLATIPEATISAIHALENEVNPVRKNRVLKSTVPSKKRRGGLYSFQPSQGTRLSNGVKTLITGGFDRGLDFKNLAKEILKSRIKTLIFFPTTGQKIWKEIEIDAKALKTKQLPSRFFVDNMKDAVILAYRETKRGEICLLSCASASFNLFKDYRDRGNSFKYNVKKLSST